MTNEHIGRNRSPGIAWGGGPCCCIHMLAVIERVCPACPQHGSPSPLARLICGGPYA